MVIPTPKFWKVLEPTPSLIETAKLVTLLQRMVLFAGRNSLSLTALKLLYDFVETEAIEQRQKKEIGPS